MAIQDKTVVIKGVSTKLTCVELWPQVDGSVLLVAVGSTVDAVGNLVPLVTAKITATGVAALDNLVTRALIELRKANGLET